MIIRDVFKNLKGENSGKEKNKEDWAVEI